MNYEKMKCLRDAHWVFSAQIQNSSPYRRVCCLHTHTHKRGNPSFAHSIETRINNVVPWNPKKKKLICSIHTLSTGVTCPSFKVKISESDNDWDVSPCLRKAGPFSSKSLSILSYNLDLCSSFKITESDASFSQVKHKPTTSLIVHIYIYISASSNSN